MKTQLRIMQFWLGLSGMAAWTCAEAAPLSLANSPLFLGTSVDANVFFEVDDSGSMDWETLTNEFEYFRRYWDDDSTVGKIDHGQWESYCSGSYCTKGWTDRRAYGYIFPEADRLYQSTSSYGSVALYDSRNTEAIDSDWRVRSSDFNLVYYNPAVTYRPWTSSMSDVSFSSAPSNPKSTEDGYNYKRNLAGFVFEVWIDDHGYSGTRPNGPLTATNTPNGIVDLWDSRVRYTVNDSSIVVEELRTSDDIPGIKTECTLSRARASVPYSACYGTTLDKKTLDADDVNPWGRTLAEEQQNVANWYSYGRKRQYAAKAAIAAVVEATTGFRYGLSLINGGLFVEVPGAGDTDYATHNTGMLNSLFSYNWGEKGTPLRAGLEDVGNYFDNTDKRTNPIYSQCQQNFALLLTDGYWSGDSIHYQIQDVDGDGRKQTVADIARFYYNKDLDDAKANTVPTSVIDPNNKQHLVTFTVAFGVKGDLVDTDNDGYPNPTLKENSKWGDDPGSSNPGKIDDLWHAAFNSKGEFVSARTPAEMIDALADSLAEIGDRVGSSASVATNSGQLNAGSHVFQARFDSSQWSGQLLAFAINPDGSLRPNASWDASKVLDLQNYNTGRTILTWNPQIDIPSGGAIEGRGVPFRFPAAYQTPNGSTDMGSVQLQALMKHAPYAAEYGTTNSTKRSANQNYGAALVNFLRGHRGNEGSGTYAFRTRKSVLGDIVDSDPQYVGPPRFRYPDNLESSAYSAFAATQANRTPMVYVGANDGMLHGFQESNGQEKIAYVPSKVFKNLPELSRSTYTHQHFVNEAPTIVDAWLPSHGGTGAWRTVLVGGLGRGGQGIYALDVTDPSTFSEANASSLVLWEFTDADSTDLGYTYSQISIAKMANGKWAAVFGNGYNNTEADGPAASPSSTASSTGYASLFIVDIETGDLIKKISTNVGSTTTPNGLASPALVDANGDFMVDYIYAGDLRGNMWKFDVTSSNTDNWKVAYTQSGNPKPLFTTATGADQPITTRPVLTSHPAGHDGFMVYFGTGKYIETTDNDPTGAKTQAFYGIWDKNLATHTTFTAAANLVKQSITDQRTVNFNDIAAGEDNDDKRHTVRDFSDYAVDYSTKHGWYIELAPAKVGGSANTANFGEKQVTNALVRNGRVIFTTLIPSQNQCEFGGTSFTYQLDFANGGLLGDPPFDLNGDGTFDSTDTNVGGVQSKVGIIPTLSVIFDGDQEIAFGSGSSGDIESMRLNPGPNAVGRQSWRQIK